MHARLREGETVANYIIREAIGEGGMGIVYRADHQTISRRAAIKVLHPDTGASAEMVARVFNEARAASQLDNPHVVEVMDVGRLPDGNAYMVMEWLEGESLGQTLVREERLGIARAVHILAGVGSALAAAHARGIVHRDLKPDNIFLVTRKGDPDFVKVLDFGIAKLTDTGSGAAFKTKTGVILGTPAYMSPEQCRGTSAVDNRSDIYQLGVVGYQTICGRLPFVREGWGEYLIAHLTETPPTPSSLNPAINPALDQVLLRALAKEAGDRFATVTEMVAALEGAAGGPRTTVLPPAAPEPPESTQKSTPKSTQKSTQKTSAKTAPAPVPTTMRSAAGEAAPPRRAPSKLWVVVPALVVFAVAGAIGVGRRRTPVPPAPPPAAPVVRAVAPPAVRVSIRATPAQASLSIDGARVANPFVSEGAPSSEARTLTVSAPGYKDLIRVMTFDRPFELELALLPEDRPPALPRPRRAAASPTSPRHPVEAPGDPLRAKSPLLDGLDEFMRKRPKLNADPRFPDR